MHGRVKRSGREVTVNAPIGKPPVFYRADSEWAALFASLKASNHIRPWGNSRARENNDESHHNGRSSNSTPAL